LSQQQLTLLESVLLAGPAASGFAEDQRWTLARIATVTASRFHIRYSPKGVSLALRRLGWTPQMLKHRAIERNEEAITRWKRYQWPAVKGSRAGWARGSASSTRRPKRETSHTAEISFVGVSSRSAKSRSRKPGVTAKGGAPGSPGCR
jgi:putative transposase